MRAEQLLHRRSSGILLHATSLPGRQRSGDLGPAAYRFAAWLARAEQSWWQMLPLGPPGAGRSPYDSPSSFAGSPSLVSPELLARDGLLGRSELDARRGALLPLAFARFRAGRSKRLVRELERFRESSGAWLADYALFSALKRAYRGACWTAWDPPLRDRNRRALAAAEKELSDEILYHELVQLLFHQQWSALRAHCHRLGISLLGDVPMYVAHDGADVWANRELFLLDARGERSALAGVPPDDFSRTGQLWGNPLYRWAQLKKTGFAWWIARLGTTLERFDAVRLDHFIGFRRAWQVPAGARTARRGRFVRVPGEAFFETVRDALGGLPFIAEDLGLVTPEVHALRERFELPGMRVLSFAFYSEDNEYLPHRYPRNTVVYTGTHDNDTAVGWYRKLDRASKRRLHAYAGGEGREMHWELVRLASMSVANVALFPLQDVLGLGSSARMNVPGTAEGNWRWRFGDGDLTPDLADRLGEITSSHGRTGGRAT